ncbi:MAG: Bax inhibitor-1 family protein, partial [Pseudomonadota bacterium]|nr:Bax inhibitor-1 family protein [Pseudomonadota bacterium]
LGGYFALLYLTNKYRNSGKGLICVFALTGFMGYTLGPIIGTYWAMAPNIVVQAMAGTAIVFTTMSVIAVRLKRDLSNLAKTLFVGILVAFLAGIGAIVFEIPALSLAVSAMFVVLMSAMILYQTNQILHGGESNYIMATVSLYVALFNLFTSLLHLLGFSQLE